MLSYRIVLVAHARVGHIDAIFDLARQLGYPYFLWNDRVYKMPEGFDKYVTDTGLTVKDVQ